MSYDPSPSTEEQLRDKFEQQYCQPGNQSTIVCEDGTTSVIYRFGNEAATDVQDDLPEHLEFEVTQVGMSERRVFPLTRDKTLIGRSPDCDLVLSHRQPQIRRYLSRTHLLLERYEEFMRIHVLGRDIELGNRTYKRGDVVHVELGDCIRVPGFELRLREARGVPTNVTPIGVCGDRQPTSQGAEDSESMKIMVYLGDQPLTAVNLPERTWVTVGRDPTCHVRIPNTRYFHHISRITARLYRIGDRIMLHDTGSKTSLTLLAQQDRATDTVTIPRGKGDSVTVPVRPLQERAHKGKVVRAEEIHPRQLVCIGDGLWMRVVRSSSEVASTTNRPYQRAS